MWGEYFCIVAFLFLAYLCLRYAIIAAVKLPALPREPVHGHGKGIEAEQISNRIQQVRVALAHANVPGQAAGFKRALMVQNKRAQIAGMAFFQARPPVVPKSDDESHQLRLLVV